MPTDFGDTAQQELAARQSKNTDAHSLRDCRILAGWILIIYQGCRDGAPTAPVQYLLSFALVGSAVLVIVGHLSIGHITGLIYKETKAGQE